MSKQAEWDFRCRKCKQEFTLVGTDIEFCDVVCVECFSGDLELIGYDFSEYERYLESLLRKKVTLKDKIDKMEERYIFKTKKPHRKQFH